MERTVAEPGMVLVHVHEGRTLAAERSIFDGMKRLDLLLQQVWMDHEARAAEGYLHLLRK